MNTLGPTVEQLVEKAYQLKGDIDTLEIRLKEIKGELVEVARARRGKENTVRIHGVDVDAVIRFGQTTSYDSAALLDVMLLLGEKRFSKLFTSTRVFRARPELGKFLKAKGNLKARRAIASAMKVTNNSPKMTFEEADK